MLAKPLEETRGYSQCVKMNVSSIVRGSRSAFLKRALKAVAAVNPRLNAKLEWVNGFSSSKTASSQGKSHLISALMIRVGIPQKNRKAQSRSVTHDEMLCNSVKGLQRFQLSVSYRMWLSLASHDSWLFRSSAVCVTRKDPSCRAVCNHRSAPEAQKIAEYHLLTSITRSKRTFDTLRLERSLPVQY
jgi:hypothetical protein